VKYNLKNILKNRLSLNFICHAIKLIDSLNAWDPIYDKVYFIIIGESFDTLHKQTSLVT
jgi:hypothetical protein